LKKLNAISKGPGREIILENVQANKDRDLKCLLYLLPPNAERLNIVAGGPSLKKYVKKLKRRKDKIITVNGAHDYLIKKGVIPWATAFLDPDPILTGMFTPHKDVKYYVSSMCHPSVFEKLDGHDVVMWHAEQGVGEDKILGDVLRISGGCTVSLRCINLGYTLGFRDFHIYGLDSSFSGAHHAYKQDEREDILDVYCKGRKFTTTIALAAQAQDFQNLYKRFGYLFKLSVHGDGLIPHMFKHMHIGDNNASK
jgi:hypothetical protein